MVDGHTQGLVETWRQRWKVILYSCENKASLDNLRMQPLGLAIGDLACNSVLSCSHLPIRSTGATK
jgi:PIN domain nuclease of toxin-antitoxin system